MSRPSHPYSFVSVLLCSKFVILKKISYIQISFSFSFFPEFPIDICLKLREIIIEIIIINSILMHKTNHKSFVFLDKVYSKTSNDVFHGQCPKYDI